MRPMKTRQQPEFSDRASVGGMTMIPSRVAASAASGRYGPFTQPTIRFKDRFKTHCRIIISIHIDQDGDA